LYTGAFGFATATLTLSLFNLGVQGIEIPNAVLGFALFYGGLTQYLAGLWEFATGESTELKTLYLPNAEGKQAHSDPASFLPLSNPSSLR